MQIDNPHGSTALYLLALERRFHRRATTWTRPKTIPRHPRLGNQPRKDGPRRRLRRHRDGWRPELVEWDYDHQRAIA